MITYLVGVVLGLALFVFLGWHAREFDRDRLVRLRDTFVCARCTRCVSVDEGAHDCQPSVCDDCWFVLHQQGACARCEAEDGGDGRIKSDGSDGRSTP